MNVRLKEIEERMESCTDYWVDNGEFMDDMKYMLSTIKRYEEALKYYATLHERLYHDAQVGELYESWWARQSVIAQTALRGE